MKTLRALPVRGAILAGLSLLGARSASAQSDDLLLSPYLGAASAYEIVAQRLTMKGAFDNNRYGIQSGIAAGTYRDSSCAESGRFTATSEDATVYVDDDLVLLASPGRRAGVFGGYKDPYEGAKYPGVEIGANLITGGGRIVGRKNIDLLAGVVDNSGANPKIATCHQALSDIQSVSDEFAEMPATQSFARLDIRGRKFTITTVPGINIINIGSLYLRNAKDGDGDKPPTGATLNIERVPGTTLTVINITGQLLIGSQCVFNESADPDGILINVHGAGPAVRLNFASVTTAWLLAPQRRIESRFAWIQRAFGRTVALQGSNYFY